MVHGRGKGGTGREWEERMIGKGETEKGERRKKDWKGT